MFLSESEVDTQLAALRHQRDVIERKIADLLLFRELGRRLAGADGPNPGSTIPQGDTGSAAVEEGAGRAKEPISAVTPAREPTNADREQTPISLEDRTSGQPSPGEWGLSESAASGRDARPSARQSSERRSPPVPPVPFEEDPVAARRYGRALLDAVIEVLGEVGRPLHAGELLERVVARGFTVPGQDPVAALNTRLWKRSGPGKPLRRLGEAVYALSEPPAA